MCGFKTRFADTFESALAGPAAEPRAAARTAVLADAPRLAPAARPSRTPPGPRMRRELPA
jgi:hypothetical protein